MPDDLVAVVHRAQRGDREAFLALYDRFAPYVRTVCLDQTRDWHAMLDLSQDIFMVVLKDIGKLRRAAAFPAWIKRITQHHVRAFIGTRQRTARFIECETVLQNLPAFEDPNEAQRLLELRAAMRQLPPHRRHVVWLFYVEGLPIDDIAQLCDISRRTVFAAIDDSKQRLRRLLVG